MTNPIPASILLEKAKHKLPEVYVDYNAQVENDRLMPLLEAAVKIIEVQAEALDNCYMQFADLSSRVKAPDAWMLVELKEAQAKVQEILGGVE